MTYAKQWQAWCQRFDALRDGILDLFHSRRVWWVIRAMIDANPRVQRTGIAEHWLTRCYALSQLTAIRRVSDKDTRTASLRRCLDQLAERPDMATRAWYEDQLERRGTSHRYRASLAAVFGLFAGPGQAHVDPQLIRQDIDRLETAAGLARQVVNKVVAHHEFRPGAVAPQITWGELDNAIDVTGALYKKYYQLRHPGSVLGSLVPDLPTGWERMFETAWKPAGFELPGS